jgi:hypothetical protein
MSEMWAHWLWIFVAGYLTVGFVFAILFVTAWVSRLESSAAQGTWGFRLAILPGAAALWPLLIPKVLRARHDTYRPPDAEHTASASHLRRWHGGAWIVLAVIVPFIGGAALLSRPRENPGTVVSLEPPPLPEILSIQTASGLPIEVIVRTDGRRKQLQLQVDQPLEEPVVAAYWTPEADASTSEAVFLGAVWGPARLTFSLPDGSLARPGTLTLIALSDRQRTLATLPLQR